MNGANPLTRRQVLQHSQTLTVQYDAQLLAWQQRGGISNYFANLVSEFDRDPALGIRSAGVPQYTQNPQAIALGMGRPLPPVVPRRVRAVRAMNAPRQAISSMRHRDLVHHTYYANRDLSKARGAVRVVTVYDMIPEMFPALFPRGNPHQHKLRHVAAADLILCISETTRHDLLRFAPAVADRIRVTPLGVSPEYLERTTPPADSATERPYLLYVGMRTFHKNFDVVLRAMPRVDADVDLVLAGGGALTSAERERLEELGITGRVRQLTPSDGELRILYRSALAFVFPSRYEGFGLPVIEAMASGCPALLSRTPVFEEIASDDALYFDPDDDAMLAQSVRELLGRAELRADLIRTGRERAGLFTWASTAAGTAAAYREAVGG